MITIVDYGVGNLVSVKKAFDLLGESCEITSDTARVSAAAKIVLPGVGHFASTDALTQSGLRSAIAEAVAQGVPFLGICVGMQWMLERSEESPQTPGLALLNGGCEKFPALVKSPHVGWNSIDIHPSSRLFQGYSAGIVRLFHSFLSSSGHRRHRGLLRIRRQILCCSRARSHVRCAVPSGEIR